MINIFISHASEDKENFVRGLAHELNKQGIRIWYDEFSLKAGDSLRESIDKGLSECTAGLVILSKSFFAKEWPQRELSALYSSEISGQSKIIPIWHEITDKEVLKASPLLADKVAIINKGNVKEIASEVCKSLDIPGKYSSKELAVTVENYFDLSNVAAEAFLKGCQHRFLALHSLRVDLYDFTNSIIENYVDDEGYLLHDEEASIEAEKERLQKRFNIPEDAYAVEDDPIREQFLSSYMHGISNWASGTLTEKTSYEFIQDLDMAEFDEYYILLDIPNFTISKKQRPLLNSILVAMGYGFEDAYEEAREVCSKLKASDDSA